MRGRVQLPMEYMKKGQLQYIEVDTKERAERLGREQQVRERTLSADPKKKSPAAEMGNFSGSGSAAAQRAALNEEEEERKAYEELNREWDDMIDRKIVSAIAVRANAYQIGGADHPMDLPKARAGFKECVTNPSAEPPPLPSIC
jgi:hypothetical protein